MPVIVNLIFHFIQSIPDYLEHCPVKTFDSEPLEPCAIAICLGCKIKIPSALTDVLGPGITLLLTCPPIVFELIDDAKTNRCHNTISFYHFINALFTILLVMTWVIHLFFHHIPPSIKLSNLSCFHIVSIAFKASCSAFCCLHNLISDLTNLLVHLLMSQEE